MTQFNRKEFGRRLAYLREEMHLTQNQLGEEIGCSGKYVSKLENGEAMPSMELFVNICNCCHVSSSHLMVVQGYRCEDENMLLLEMIDACGPELKHIIWELVRLYQKKA